MSSDAEAHVEALRRIVDDGVRAAYLHLLVECERAGLRSSAKSGIVPAVRLHDRRNRYLFSYIPNQRHLLFYVRHPALDLAPDLAREAEDLFGSGASRNPAGETTVRIETLDEAVRIATWIASRLPLP